MGKCKVGTHIHLWNKVLFLHLALFFGSLTFPLLHIRRYTNGSWLTNHVDRFNTHVISAILNVAQDVGEDWPLYILDNAGNTHKVVIQPGQMVWYESARAVHGRPQPLHGNYYDNIFIHFKPFGKWYSNPFHVNDHKGLKPIKLEDLDRISN